MKRWLSERLNLEPELRFEIVQLKREIARLEAQATNADWQLAALSKQLLDLRTILEQAQAFLQRRGS